MKISRFAQLAVAVFLLTSLVGCKGILPPKVGHYTGTNPNISFDITSEGIQNLSIIMTANIGNVPNTCTGSAGSLPISIQPDGSFSFKFNQQAISGVVDGSSVKGHYTDDTCDVPSSDGTGLVEVAPSVPLDIDWTATYIGPVATNTPILPPKPGHYTGSKPDVSFDVTSAGVESFSAAGTISTGLGNCELFVREMGPISISPDGRFSSKSANDELTGFIHGDAADGNWTVYSCGGDGPLYSNAAGFSGSWNAHWVSP
jgi:hypothetical protein